MDKSTPPRSFGVFKPVGHTVVAFGTARTMEEAADSLVQGGFAPSDMVRYTPAEMITQVNADLLTASPLAAVGQELNLIRAHRALAQNGCSFLVVHAPDAEQAARVDVMVQTFKPASAQRYTTFLIEDLTTRRETAGQSFESPDRASDMTQPEKMLR